MGGQTNGRRRAWLWAFALAASAPLLTFAFLSASDWIDGDEVTQHSVVWQVSWYAWTGGSIAAAVAAGMFPGFLRGVTASLVVWSVLMLATYVAIGPSCPLNMSAAPSGGAVHGVAALSVVDAFGQECYGGDPSRGNNLIFLVPAAVFATGLAAIGGLLGAVGRWALRRGPLVGDGSISSRSDR